MSDAIGTLVYVGMCIAWLAGIVLAAGWWKLLAAVFPFYAWYLVVEHLMRGSA